MKWFLILLLIKPMPDGSDTAIIQRIDHDTREECGADMSPRQIGTMDEDGKQLVFKACIGLRAPAKPGMTL